MVLCAAALAETARWVVGRQVGLALRSVGHVGRDSTSAANASRAMHSHLLIDYELMGPPPGYRGAVSNRMRAELHLTHTHEGGDRWHEHKEYRHR